MTTHLIQRQYLHVELAGTEIDGLALQQKLPGVCRDSLAPAIERILDRYAPVDEYLLFDRLEIKTRALTLERWEEEVADVVAKALEELLQNHLAAHPRSPAAGSDALQRKTEQESIRDAFLHFLRHGTLPWSFRLPAGRTLEEAVLVSWQLPDWADSGLHRIIRALLALLKSETIRERLVRQFSPDFLRVLLVQISPMGAMVLAGILSRLQSVSLSFDDRKRLERVLGEAMLTCVAIGGSPTETDLIDRAYRALVETDAGQRALADVVAQLWPGVVVADSATPGRKDRTVPTKPRSLLKPKRQGSRDIAAVSLREGDDPKRPPGTGPEKPAPYESCDPSAQGTERRYLFNPDPEEGIYIENAGLVLLHPFLPLFFETLAITGEERLLRPERALCLLHYLATGQVVAPEYELPLPKILCNIDPETPVESDVGLTGRERDEAASLLEAVIRHWGALGNSSLDGLRGTFLLRKGKISRQDSDWLLQVERETCDILLDQLPWGLSMIKLPWMERLLRVEWL